MNQETQKTDAQITSEFILSLKQHSEYVPVPDLPIPLLNSVLVKYLPPPIIVENKITLLDGGEQSLFEKRGENSQDTNEGIIMAVGPTCSSYMRIGLKCQYSSEAKSKFRHKGQEYIKMDEYSVYFIVPDETTLVDNGVKDPRELRRAKKMEQQVKTFDNVHKADQYEKDVANDKTKGKVHKMK